MLVQESISVVIPCYNEKNRIPATLDDISVFQREHPGVVDEVVVVDDCSKDGSGERVMWFLGKVQGLRLETLPVNGGKWSAIRQGLEAAKNDAILLLDADGSANIKELLKIHDLKYIMKKKRAVFGSRFMLGSSVDGKSGFRSFISHGYRIYVRFWYWVASRKTDVDDMQCPFKLVFRSKLKFLPQPQRWCGDMELASAVPEEIYNHPVEFVHKAGGHVRSSTIVNMAVETMKVALRLRRARNASKDNAKGS